MNKDKQAIRKKLLEQLLALTESQIKRRSSNVEKHLSRLPIYNNAKTLMVYYPLKGEVDILETIRKEFRSKRFCFPVMDLKAKNLRIFETTKLIDDFVCGPYSVMEPDIKKAREVSIEEIDVVIVPGLGYDLQKNRLGRGAGFYDRFLQRLTPSTKKVGLAFDFQILDSLPIDLAFDQKVDYIVSEDRII